MCGADRLSRKRRRNRGQEASSPDLAPDRPSRAVPILPSCARPYRVSRGRTAAASFLSSRSEAAHLVFAAPGGAQGLSPRGAARAPLPVCGTARLAVSGMPAREDRELHALASRSGVRWWSDWWCRGPSEANFPRETAPPGGRGVRHTVVPGRPSASEIPLRCRCFSPQPSFIVRGCPPQSGITVGAYVGAMS